MKIKMPQGYTFKLISESTTAGDFPPSSSTTGVRCLAAAAITIRPTLPLPAHRRIMQCSGIVLSQELLKAF